MVNEISFWGPMVALVAGALAGLGVLRSRRWALGLALGVAFLQIIAWMTLALILWKRPEEDWNITLWASFLLALMYVAPFTAIGAVIVGSVVGLVRWWGRKEPAP
jgi:hypothetical protein